MKQGVLLFLLAILLGCTGNKQVDNSPIVEVTDSVMVAKGYDEVELFKTRTGHITATLSVNGKPCIFLIDTGGGATLIDKSKKYKFGLEASKTGDYAAGIGASLGTFFSGLGWSMAGWTGVCLVGGSFALTSILLSGYERLTMNSNRLNNYRMV